MKRCFFMLLVACACPSKKTSGPAIGSNEGGGAGSQQVQVTATTCDSTRAKVEQLYRSEGQVKEPKRVEDYVADNTKMVMNDCAKDPAKTVPCIAKAQSIADLEKLCLAPLDDEGTEGEAPKR